MSGNLPLHKDLPPLHMNDAGIILVGLSRVSLDVVVAEYEQGKSPEEIVQEYDTLNLADVHASIAYYLRHLDEVSEYLRNREQAAKDLQAMVESQQSAFPSKNELIGRQSKDA